MQLNSIFAVMNENYRKQKMHHKGRDTFKVFLLPTASEDGGR